MFLLLANAVRYAMTIIEIPVEVNPDGSYVQLKDRMRMKFVASRKEDLPEPGQLPTTVDWNLIFPPPLEVEFDEVAEEVAPTVIETNEIDEIDLMPPLDFSQKHVRKTNGPMSLRTSYRRENSGRFTRR